MPAKKKTSNVTSKREKELEKTVKNLEEKIRKIEEAAQIEESIKEKKEN